MNCSRTNCKNKSVAIDFRPAYIDNDGEADCFGKVATCDECVTVSHEEWLKGKDDAE